jgi:hypothetical protein
MSDHIKMCPGCKATGVLIIYGMPDPVLVELAEDRRGEIPA